MREGIPDPRNIVLKREERLSEGAIGAQENIDRGMTRRSLLKKLAGGVAGLAVGGGEGVLRIPDLDAWTADRVRRMRFERWDGMPAAERERLITAEVTAVRDFIRGPEGTRILESGSDDEIFDLIYAMPALLREHLEGTRFEVGTGEWPSVAVSLDPDDNEVFVLGANYGPDVIAKTYHGNGVFVAPDTLMTNCHVLMSEKDFQDGSTSSLARNPALSSLWQKYTKGFADAAFVQFKGPVSLETAAHKPPVFPLAHLSDADVTGNPIMVQAIDPDRSAAKDGTKAYFSLAIPVTKRVAQFLRAYNFYNTDQYVQASFMYIRPPGESMRRPFASKTGSRLLDFIMNKERVGQEAFGQGTSGSPVFMDGKLVGLNHRAGQIRYKGIDLDVAFFLGPTELQQARNKMTVRAADMQINPTYASYTSGYDEPGYFDTSSRSSEK